MLGCREEPRGTESQPRTPSFSGTVSVCEFPAILLPLPPRSGITGLKQNACVLGGICDDDFLFDVTRRSSWLSPRVPSNFLEPEGYRLRRLPCAPCGTCKPGTHPTLIVSNPCSNNSAHWGLTPIKQGCACCLSRPPKASGTQWRDVMASHISVFTLGILRVTHVPGSP